MRIRERVGAGKKTSPIDFRLLIGKTNLRGSGRFLQVDSIGEKGWPSLPLRGERSWLAGMSFLSEAKEWP